MCKKSVLKRFLLIGSGVLLTLPLVGMLQAAELISKTGLEPVLSSVEGRESLVDLGELKFLFD